MIQNTQHLHITWIYSQIHVFLVPYIIIIHTYIITVITNYSISKMMPVFPPKKHMPNDLELQVPSLPSPPKIPPLRRLEAFKTLGWFGLESLPNPWGRPSKSRKDLWPQFVGANGMFLFLWVYSEPPKKQRCSKKKEPFIDVMNPSHHFSLETLGYEKSQHWNHRTRCCSNCLSGG